MQDTNCDLVSVVIPVYNAERYLQQTLDSVFRQTYRNIEVVAVDDGSTDQSLQILESYGDQLKLVKQPNKGAAAARNLGARVATGKWIAFLDSDDIWAADKTRQQLEDCAQYLWSYSDNEFYGGVNNGKKDSDFSPKSEGNILQELIQCNFIGTSSVIIDREMFLGFGGFDESLDSIEDWELWMRIAAQHKAGYCKKALVQYRIPPASMSRSTRRTLPSHMVVIDRVFGAGGPAAHLAGLLNQTKANSYGICSDIAEEEGDQSFSVYCALMALRHEPLQIARYKAMIKSILKYLMAFSRPKRPNPSLHD